MERFDKLSKPFRMLVHEFGLLIVLALIDDADGKLNPLDVFDQLVVWRERKQEQWLKTDYITERTRDSFKVALGMKRAA
jgi:hypothetical protein